MMMMHLEGGALERERDRVREIVAGILWRLGENVVCVVDVYNAGVYLSDCVDYDQMFGCSADNFPQKVLCA
jgi:hypothetical protein